ncbi:MAG: hypothetical protein H7124_07130 [Phycisphaerales bacterium]|nr:hypothetical protein [Hyphomonadaceae bacterium]
MPIVLRHNQELELSLAEYRGPVSLAELEAVAAYGAQNPSFLQCDCLNLVLPGANFDSVEVTALDNLFGRYKLIFAPMEFQIVRRSAWICLSPAAQAHIDYWIGGHDLREALSSTLRQFLAYSEAGDWLVLNEAEIVALESGAGFTEVANFEDPPSVTRTAAR